MKLFLIILLAIVGFFTGYLFFTPAAVESYKAAPLPELTPSPVGGVYIVPPMGEIPKYPPDTPGPDEGVYGAPVIGGTQKMERQEDSLLSDLICGVFALFAAYLWVKNPKNLMVTIFSVAVLSTTFGRFVGPFVIPDFLQLVLQLIGQGIQ